MYTIANAKQELRRGIKTYLLKDDKGDYLLPEVNCLPFYLEGAPGIGKTQIVEQVTGEMGLGFVSFSLTHHTRNSLLGLPVIRDLEDGSKYTEYTMSEIIAKVFCEVEKGHEEGILLLDEFPCMSETILPAMLAFLQTKNIGAHKLPRGWVLVLCGNPLSYNKSARSFDAAVTDRIRKIEIEFDLGAFLEYAREKRMSDIVISYLEMNPKHIYRYVKSRDKVELVTCRSWENLSLILDRYEMSGEEEIDSEFVRQFLKSEEIAHNFVEYFKQRSCGLTEKDAVRILNGKISERLSLKYREAAFSTRWNCLSYLRSILQKDMDHLLKCEAGVEVTRKLIDVIDQSEDAEIWTLEEDDRCYPFATFENELFKNDTFQVTNPGDYQALAEAVKRLIMEPLPDQDTVGYMLSGWKEAGENVDCETLSDMKKIILFWIESQNQEMYLFGQKITNLFEFLAKIDEGYSLRERLYLIINSNSLLLRSVCIAECRPYIEMCKRQYGLETAS